MSGQARRTYDPVAGRMVLAVGCLLCGVTVPIGTTLCHGCHDAAEKREPGPWAKARAEERKRAKATGATP